MRIATWNINSVRARAERALALLQRADLDVLALQETKCKDEQFPREMFEEAGYEVATFGFSQWNGVALISRVGLEKVQYGFPGQPGFGEPEAQVEARAIGGKCGGVEVWSLYVPHGRALDNPHFVYKLNWLEQLRAHVAFTLHQNPDAQVLLGGDWNVAPQDDDVWDLAPFADGTHISPAERSAFAAFAKAGLTEVSRQFLPAPHTYTYWDYQQLRFPKNQGMRIDFTYTSPALTQRVTGVEIDRDERKGKGASDHVPVIVTLD